MIDPADLAGLPPPAAAPERIPRRRPPNYLAAGARRRLLWRVMPWALAALLGLTWVEHAWFGGSALRPAAPVDTRLETVRGPRPGDDAVIIEPAADPEAAGRGADAAALARVRDDTLFRAADLDAWTQTFATLRDTGRAALDRAPAARVSFSELFGQPRSFRGRLVRLRGTLRRLERLVAPENSAGIADYWQGWLEPAGGPATPIVVHFLERPEGMAAGMKIEEPVDVVGYFLKRHAYAATDTVRVAPLVLALEPLRRPPPASVPGASLGTWALVSMVALVLATVLGIRLAARSPDRRAAAPPVVDLTAALAGHEPFSPAAALGRLGDDVRAAATEVRGDRA